MGGGNRNLSLSNRKYNHPQLKKIFFLEQIQIIISSNSDFILIRHISKYLELKINNNLQNDHGLCSATEGHPRPVQLRRGEAALPAAGQPGAGGHTQQHRGRTAPGGHPAGHTVYQGPAE